MMDARVVQHLLREDVLQGESNGRNQRTDQSDHVERNFGERCNGDAGNYGHQTKVDDGGLTLAQDDAR